MTLRAAMPLIGGLLAIAWAEPSPAIPADDPEIRAAEEAGGRVLHRRDVGGWRIVYFSEGDGGLQVRMARRGAGYFLEYHVSWWRGNGGPIRGATMVDGECNSGEAGDLNNPDDEWNAGTVRERFGEYFAECQTSSLRAAEMLGGFDRAFAQLAAWSFDAEAATVAENEAIADHGR